MHIVITDCDHDSIELEREIARRHGHTLELAAAITEDEVIAAARGADAILVQYAQVSAAVLAELGNLKAVGRYGVGFDTVDVPAATAHGVAVCNVPDYGTEDVSDHAIALALSLARGVVRLNRDIHAGSWTLSPARPLYRIRDRVFGVIGLGAIGGATARKAAGLGYQVIAHDIVLNPGTVTADGIPAVTLDEVLERAQVLSLHVPLDASTTHMISTEQLARMRPDAILVNTCRGPVVDTVALVEALRAGVISGAALDVHESEPLPADSALRTLDQVVLTPHVAWYSEESYLELKRRTVENVVEVLAGRRPRNIVNPGALSVPTPDDPQSPGNPSSIGASR
jgi:D-3-phosphoglycerate dehydrogenase / 2-oxoglutarate reductase